MSAPAAAAVPVTVTGISPAAGTVAGGTTVTAVVTVSNTRIVCQTPADRAGAATVTVTVHRLETPHDSLTNGYTYTAVAANPASVAQDFSNGITGGGQLSYATAGPDGNLWFTENVGNKIGRITPAGVVTEFPNGGAINGKPYGITTGPDRNLWFATFSPDSIGVLLIAPPHITGITPLNGSADAATTVTIGDALSRCSSIQ